MVNILDIARGNEQPQINMNKLRELCSRKSVSDYFRLDMAGFLNLSESKQSQLTTRFYFENINTVTTQQQQPTDTSIGSIIKKFRWYQSYKGLRKWRKSNWNEPFYNKKQRRKKVEIRDYVVEKWFFRWRMLQFFPGKS